MSTEFPEPWQTDSKMYIVTDGVQQRDYGEEGA